MKKVTLTPEDVINPGSLFLFLRAHFFGMNGLIRALLVLNVIGLVGIWATNSDATENRAELLLVPMGADTGETEASVKPEQAPILSTRINSRVTGHIVRTTVIQTFSNPTQNWMEGMYYFPLPDDASVDRMTLKIGERVISSEIQEKSQAVKTYTKAAAAGKVSALLTQYRPNMFSTRVANMEPGGTLDVEISFQSVAAQNGTNFSWRMPQAITPRFDPTAAGLRHQVRAEGVDIAGPADEENSGSNLPQLEDYSDEGGRNVTSFDIVMRRADQLSALKSPSHQIRTTDLEGGDLRIELAKGGLPADRDFVLSWTFAQGAAMKPILFQETVGDATYTLGFVLPPVRSEEQPVKPRDVTFVVDVSGSMHGTSLEQAKEALETALDLLTDQDRFEIIVFNDAYFRLFEKSLPANPENIVLARKFIARLSADNGTNMYPALKSALSDPSFDGYQKQILFLTDGAVSNEAEMFELVSETLGDARLFTVGVGSAPNGWFMRKAAEFGKGVHIQISDIGTARSELEALFRDMANPTARNINIQLSPGADIYPKIFPDLYGERPLIFAAREEILSEEGTLTAETAKDEPLTFPLSGEKKQTGQEIAKLWASKKVEGLMDARARGMDGDIVRTAVLDVALTHQIMSPYTSFVAVDKTPVRVKEDFLQKMKVSGNMPAGTSWKKIHGPKTATAMELYALTGMAALLLSMLLLFRAWRKEARL
ncbi:MAG: marine proteobacterial sortase target protein [Sneathiella sp.]